jgi:glycosyltransferase involved in cell wall biosynthesis
MEMTTVPAAEVVVVLRTKNRPLFLARALRSVLAQTFTDYLVTVVNDAGDRSVVDEAVDAVREDFGDRVTVIHNSVSRGREAAMNRGIEATTSPLVTIHDDLVGVATRAAVVHERIDGEQIVEERREVLAADRSQVSLIDALMVNGVPQNSLLYRRAALSSDQPYDESLPVLSDWKLLLDLLQVGEVGFLDGDPLAFWHLRETALGDAGNSVYVDGGHDPWNLVVRDRYLRGDLQRHQGLGYLLALTEIMERDRQVARDRGDALVGVVHRVQSSVDEVRGVESDLAAAVQHLYDRHGEVVAQLTEVNRNLVSQNNRLVAQLELLGGRLADLERRLPEPGADPAE